MENPKELIASIIRNVVLFWLFHTTVFVTLALVYGFFPQYLGWYVLSSLAVSALLLGMLLYARQHFIFLETKIALKRVNLANQLTMFRITSLPAILFLFIASRSFPITIPVIIYMAASFLTDTLDGLVSRTTHQVTRIGQYLDSMGDYAVLIGVAIAFAYFNFIPVWFFVVVLVRFAVQWAAMGALFLLQHGTIEPRASLLGKISVASCMGVFALGLLQLFPWYATFASLMWWVEIAVALVLGISLVEKLWFFGIDLRSKKAASGDKTPA